MIEIPSKPAAVVMTEERLNDVVKIVTDKVMKGQPTKAMLTLRRILAKPYSRDTIKLSYEIAQMEIETRKRIKAAIREYIQSEPNVKIIDKENPLSL